MFFNRKKYKVINLFKVCDLKTSLEFNFKEYSNKSVKYFQDKEYVKFEAIEINYGEKRWQTYAGFYQGVNKIENRDLTSLMLSSKNNSFFLNISNSLTNINNPPPYGVIDIQIIILEDFFIESTIKNFISLSSSILEFDYGYIFTTNDNKTFEEKNLFFSQRRATNVNFLFYSLGVHEGYIKKVYKYNFINRSHLKQPIIKKLITDKIGNITMLNNNLFIWKLTNDEYVEATKRLNNSKFVIVNNKKPELFINEEAAEQFYNLMKIH